MVSLGFVRAGAGQTVARSLASPLAGLRVHIASQNDAYRTLFGPNAEEHEQKRTVTVRELCLRQSALKACLGARFAVFGVGLLAIAHGHYINVLDEVATGDSADVGMRHECI